MRLLLAGPGTGKTTKIKELIGSHSDLNKILILSFTNATIHDLLNSFNEAKLDIKDKNCLTLHRYALRINHQKDLHILNATEENILGSYAKKFNIGFEDLCKTLSCVTFEQMITQTIAYIKSNPVYLRDLIGEINLLVVDEYQDFNPLERELISLIAQNASDTVILGDDDQCIYEFKDADTEGIIQLFNDTAVENIQHHNICYRCPDCVIDACSSLIAKNQRRVTKNWNKSGKNGYIIFNQLRTQVDTTNFVVREIEEIKKVEPQASIMILSAVEFAIEGVATNLKEKDIPYTSLWNLKVDSEKLKRIWEARAILGNKKILNLLFLIYQNIKGNKKLLAAVNEKVTKALDIGSLLQFVDQNNLIDTLILNMIKNGSTLSDLTRKEEYAFVAEYLNETSLENDLEKISKLISEPVPFDQDGINILSIHKSKGLQADYVFIMGMVDGILPNALRGLDSMEMQRRLFFVGMSRAKTKLSIVSTIEWDGKYVNKVDKRQFKFDIRSRKYHGRTSVFVSELNLATKTIAAPAPVQIEVS